MTEFSKPSKDRLFKHTFDGIEEYDNPLPGWWKYIFYVSILFSVVYFAWYHIGIHGESISKSYAAEWQAHLQWKQELRMKSLGALSDEALFKMRSDAGMLSLGKTIFNQPGKCVTCHKPDGSGLVGPNLTDDYWITGNRYMEIYKTISDGGRPGKGMVAWKNQLSTKEMMAVTLYVISLHGSKPSAGKAPEGKKLGAPRVVKSLGKGTRK